MVKAMCAAHIKRKKGRKIYLISFAIKGNNTPFNQINALYSRNYDQTSTYPEPISGCARQNDKISIVKFKKMQNFTNHPMIFIMAMWYSWENNRRPTTNFDLNHILFWPRKELRSLICSHPERKKVQHLTQSSLWWFRKLSFIMSLNQKLPKERTLCSKEKNKRQYIWTGSVSNSVLRSMDRKQHLKIWCAIFLSSEQLFRVQMPPQLPPQNKWTIHYAIGSWSEQFCV